MEIIQQYWWVWLLAAIVFYGLAIRNQLGRMRRMTQKAPRVRQPLRVSGRRIVREEPEDCLRAPDDFTQGVGTLFVWATLGSLSGLTLLLSVVLHVIDWVKA